MVNVNKNEIPAATEAQEQEALFRYVAVGMRRYPMLDNLAHVPNIAKRRRNKLKFIETR